MKLKFPVAKIQSDGTPAIWLTHSHWLLLESGIIRAYLDNRKHIGKVRAREEMRKSGIQNKYLEGWQLMDCWRSDVSNSESAWNLFMVGYDAWHHVADRVGSSDRMTPEKLKSIGDREEQISYNEEILRIEASEIKEHQCAV